MWPRPARSRRGAASPTGTSQDNENDDDDSIHLASLRDQKSVGHDGPRRTLVPFGRSSALKSGSLQDLKVSPAGGGGSGGGSGGGGGGCGVSPARQQHTQSAKRGLQNQRPRLERQRSSQVSSSSNALNSTNAPGQQRQQQSRNPFRSSKSMLLLAQNQHIPQATAQLDSFMSKQQADFINYAQYQRQQQNLNWADANLNQSHSGSDQLHLSQGSNQSICQQQAAAGSTCSARAAQHNPAMSGHHQHQHADSLSANAMSKHRECVSVAACRPTITTSDRL